MKTITVSDEAFEFLREFVIEAVNDGKAALVTNERGFKETNKLFDIGDIIADNIKDKQLLRKEKSELERVYNETQSKNRAQLAKFIELKSACSVSADNMSACNVAADNGAHSYTEGASTPVGRTFSEAAAVGLIRDFGNHVLHHAKIAMIRDGVDEPYVRSWLDSIKVKK